jgi:AcrR family transcriptional regulator
MQSGALAHAQSTTRERILRVAVTLLAASPSGAPSNRRICEAAGITPPTLYHHFGDKDGLLQAVASEVFHDYLVSKRALPSTGDPATDFCQRWDSHIAFGVANPLVYGLMYGGSPLRPASRAALIARAELLELLKAIERAGRLSVSAELAADVAESTGVGVTLHLIRRGLPASDPAATVARDGVVEAIIRPLPTFSRAAATPVVGQAASRLREVLPRGPIGTLRRTEVDLMHDWLADLAHQPR